MRIAFRLFNETSKLLIDSILKNKEIELVCFVDANDHKWGVTETDYHIPYISPYRLLSMMRSGEIDKLVISPYCRCNTVNDVISESIEMGIDVNNIIVPAVPDAKLIERNPDIDICSFTVGEYKTLSRLQFHLADHCNLNCTACTHFSSLVRKVGFMDIEEIERDLRRLRQLVKHIDEIDLLGGEPLLNENWKEYIVLTKSIFEYSDITIITNGTLIRQLGDEDWRFIKDNDVLFRMSLYKPFWDKADEIVSFLKSKNVKYDVNYRVMTKFASIFLRETKGTEKDNRVNCASECNQLFHGKLAPCSRMMYVGFFNSFFNLNYPEDVAVESIYNVRDFKELTGLLGRPMPLCKYCNIHLNNQVLTEWRTVKPGGKEENSLECWIS